MCNNSGRAGTGVQWVRASCSSGKCVEKVPTAPRSSHLSVLTVDVASIAMTVVYGMLSSPPRNSHHDVLTACITDNDLLACAFSSWIPAVNLPSRIGLLLDCDQQPHLHDSSASLLPTAWLDNVQLNPPIARCLRGGVCSCREHTQLKALLCRHVCAPLLLIAVIRRRG